MEDFIVNLLLSGDRMSGAIVGGFFGAIAGVLGVLVGSILTKVFKKDKITMYTVIVFVAISLQVPKLIKPYVEENYGDKYQNTVIADMMNEWTDIRIFQVIFNHHPDAKLELQKKMKEIVFNAPAEKIFLLSQASSAEMVQKYLNIYLPKASDESIYKLLQHNFEVLHEFRNKPKLCVRYFLGQPNFAPEDITPEFIQEESNIKADLIESAINSPSTAIIVNNMDDFFEPILLKYEEKGYSIENLGKLDAIQTVPAKKGCEVALEFSDVLASLGVKQGSFVFKNLLHLNESVK